MIFERKQVELFLKEQYAGVFDDASITFHIENHVGDGFAKGVLPWIIQHTPAGGKVLDIGAGFGAFVIAARRLGLDAIGIELGAYEIAYARQRIEREFLDLNSEEIFYLGDGHDLPFDYETFDSVTLWNVLEHIPDAERMLRAADRVLKPGGCLFLICPNYSALRREAHYQVGWLPLLPRPIASRYLKMKGKNPAFFEQSIFYRTNWGILLTLRKIGMHIVLPDQARQAGRAEITPEMRTKLTQPDLIQDARKRIVVRVAKAMCLGGVLETMFAFYGQLRRLRFWLQRVKVLVNIYNPFKKSIVICAKKVI